MKTAKHYIASIAIAVTLIAGCALDTVAEQDAQIARAQAEFVEAVRVAKEERAKAALANTEQRAMPERASTEFGKAVPPGKEARTRSALAGAEPRAKPGRAGAGSGLTPDQRDVSAAIASWVDAWSRRDVAGYLAAYAKNFVVPRGRSRRQWEAERRARIVGKSWIEVKVEGLEITVGDNVATARFRQNYRSNRLTENSIKTLTLVRTNQQWLIQQERE